jgi:hypothetical protein
MEDYSAISSRSSPEAFAVSGQGPEMLLQCPAGGKGLGSKQKAEKTEILVARSVQEVEAIRNIWTAWCWNPNADIDFYLQVLHLRPEILRPHVLLLYRDGSPVAMLVGRLVLDQVEARLGYARLFKTQARTLTFIQGGQAGDMSSENSIMLISEIIRSLRKGEADLAEFRFVKTDSPFCQSLIQCPGVLMRDRFPHVQSHWKLELPDKADEIYCRLTGRARKHLRRQAKKMFEESVGDVKIKCFRGYEELNQMFEDVEEVARKTYHRGLGVGFVDNHEMRERMRLEAEKGWLRAYVLYLAHQPAAFWIGSLYDGKFFGSFIGYDDRWGQYSPGTFLMTKILEEFCSEEIEEVDYGLGDADYKRYFGNCSWDETKIKIFAPTIKGAMLNAIRIPSIFVDRVLKKALERAQLLDRIKRLWRNHAIKTAKHSSQVD